MSTHHHKYALRYETPSFHHQIEVSVMHAAQNIFDRLSGKVPGPPLASDELRWARWAITPSNEAWLDFAWPCSIDPAIVRDFAINPNGALVKDEDVQAAVDGALDQVISNWIVTHPA